MKNKSCYICSACGYESAKWYGKCPSCGAWNTFEEGAPAAVSAPSVPGTKKVAMHAQGKQARIQPITSISVEEEFRLKTGISELDRVLGGGIVKGSLILLGGDPGIGKSTLLLQICGCLGAQQKILYVSGEESVRQIKMRADRLGVSSDQLYLLAETDVETIANTILANHPDLVMIDSIQTMCVAGVNSSPGSVSQVRESSNAFLQIAKGEEIPIFLVGHVTKDGYLAGPKVLEHMVDAVLHFEGERNLSYRLLRAVKNRFGSTNEVGVFEMADVGLEAVENPSAALLEGRPVQTSGNCVACVMEGTRPLLAEVQTLVSKSNFAAARRTASGFDYSRMLMLLAVLEKRCGYYLSNLDAYLNVVGGFRLDEPAADLPVALAFASGVLDCPIPDDLLAFGEVGLSGEVRSVQNLSGRIREAKRMGFARCIVPKQALRTLRQPIEGIEILGVSTVAEAVKLAIPR